MDIEMLHIRKARLEDIDALAKLYDDLNDYLAANNNYPGWKKGVYPVKEDVLHFYESDTLYVAEVNEAFAGAIALTHEPEKEPENGQWLLQADYSEIFVIHILAVHPSYIRQGVAAALLQFAEETARKQVIKSIRLDVYHNNLAAINLYEKNGYQLIDKVDLGLAEYGLDLFCLYEKAVY